MDTTEPFKIQVSLKSQYQPLILRRQMLHEQIQRSEFNERRGASDKNLDLWLDGGIYPLDPIGKKRPRFKDVRSLLEFVGDGKDGFLGYACILQRYSEGSDFHTLHRHQMELEIMRLNNVLQSSMSDYRSACLDLDQDKQEILDLEREILALQQENSNLKSASNDYQILISSQQEKIQSLTIAVEESEQSEVALEADIELLQKKHMSKTKSLNQSHHQELQKITCEFNLMKKELLQLQRKWQRVKLTPYGYHQQNRARKDMHELVQSGGHAKAQRRLARAIIAPTTVKKVQADNVANNRKRRLCSPIESQIESGKILAHILSKKEVSTVLATPTFQSVGLDVTNQNLEKIGRHMVPQDVLTTCDQNNITQSGWNAIFQTFSKSAKSACKGIRISCLPKPYHVSLLRRELNSKFKEFVGDYYSIKNELEILPNSKSKKKESTRLTLNDNNNLFVDIEAVQRTMVILYQITPEELLGNPLMFVLKMDEAEIVHDQKLECVSITIMNRALNPEIQTKSSKYFSVQSEREIWPVGCFQVKKESHEILKWVFGQTKIPNLIAAQEAGQVLVVPRIGEFKIQWHIAADMKTIKCLYGLSHGSQAKMTCIYCCQESTKTVINTVKQATVSFAKKNTSWKSGLFLSTVEAKPVSKGDTLVRWKSIFPIPVIRVHMCMLHAFNRIVEKIVHLHFQFIWTLQDKSIQEQAITEMQRVVSATRAHISNVKIFKDAKMSGKNSDVSSKPFFNSAHAAKLFKQSCLPGGSEKLYIDIVNAEKNFMDDGESKRIKLEVWAQLNLLRPYFTKLILSNEEQYAFQNLVSSWGRAYVIAFGETYVTHYIVSSLPSA